MIFQIGKIDFCSEMERKGFFTFLLISLQTSMPNLNFLTVLELGELVMSQSLFFNESGLPHL